MCIDEYSYPCLHGDALCVDMYLCLVGCPSGEDGFECSSACFTEGSWEANQIWSLFADCLELAGYFECEEEDEECLAQGWDACGEELLACAHSDQTCAEISDCLDGCDGVELCEKSCVAYGTVQAQGLWGTVDACVADLCDDQSAPDCESEALAGVCAGALEKCLEG